MIALSCPDMRFMHQTEEEATLEVDDLASHALILYNDDVNTFEHVIESLVKICQHEVTQAEQVAWIVHTKGKCDVKHGPFVKLDPLCRKLINRGLSAQIEE